jgi:hypothetical protein
MHSSDGPARPPGCFAPSRLERPEPGFVPVVRRALRQYRPSRTATGPSGVTSQNSGGGSQDGAAWRLLGVLLNQESTSRLSARTTHDSRRSAFRYFGGVVRNPVRCRRLAAVLGLDDDRWVSSIPDLSCDLKQAAGTEETRRLHHPDFWPISARRALPRWSAQWKDPCPFLRPCW